MPRPVGRRFEAGEPWERIRERLLEASDEGQRLRTSHPFASVAKYAAHREKDSRYTRDERIQTIHIKPPEKREIVEASMLRQRLSHSPGTARRRTADANTQQISPLLDTQ